MTPSTSEHSLLTAALGLTPPWEMVSVDFDAKAKRAEVRRAEVRGELILRHSRWVWLKDR